MENIECIYFDFDHTLWDLEKNAELTLLELFEIHHFNELTSANAQDFVKLFQKHNRALWELYNNKLIDKNTLRTKRFELALNELKIPFDAQPKNLWQEFLQLCPTQKQLMPYAEETVATLAEKHPLYLLTNGFTETQKHKIENSGLKKYFQHAIISEEVGFAKPKIEIFKYAESISKKKSENILMVGDSIPMDIEGALNAGWKAIHYAYQNPSNNIPLPSKATQILDLKEVVVKLEGRS